MPDLAAIDAHVHTYRSREVGLQAMSGAGRTGYGGTPEELLAAMDRGGIERAVMVNMTPVLEMFEAGAAMIPPGLSDADREREEQGIRREMIGRLQRRNEWTCEVARAHPRLVAFIGLDPSMSEGELVAEIDRRVGEGARGIKLHPPNQRFYPNDPRLRAAYVRMQELGLPVIFHSGAFALAPRAGDHGRAEHFGELLAAFPRLTVVMAHLAFGDFDACAELARTYPNVFFDCCFVINGVDRPPAVSDEEAVAAFRRIGTDRVMFGSDYPWFDPIADAERIRRLPLTDTEKRAILHDNASRILGL
jgi:predicted TIM-barrel fold metal-dependent hydrolase